MGKMTAVEREAFLRKALQEQRHLLKTAVDGMVAGDLAQALHAATTIRVLVHETGSSKPLLKQLNKDYLELPMLEKIAMSTSDPSGRLRAARFYCPVSVKWNTADGKMSLNAVLNASDYALSTLGRWWNGMCMSLPGVGPVTRRELILGLSNKEGGAHVDDNISVKYKNLMESRFLNLKVNEHEVQPVNVSRLVAGKCAAELLDCLERNFGPIA